MVVVQALITFDCQLPANADVMELVLMRAAPYFFARSLLLPGRCQLGGRAISQCLETSD